MPGMSIMPAMTAMHEDVQKRTSQERKPNQKTEHMRAVLGKEQCADNGKEADENKSGPRCQKATLRRRAVIRLILMGHAILPLTTVVIALLTTENYG